MPHRERRGVRPLTQPYVEAFGLTSSELAGGIVECVVPEGERTDGQLVLDFLGLAALTFDDPTTDVKAILAPNERAVLVHEDRRDAQRTWSQLHEAGHWVLPEHQEVIWKCKLSDLDFTTRRRLELEANQFAADVLFQGHRFRTEAAAMPVGFEAIRVLTERYGASLEATSRRYVEESYYPCALIVYSPEAGGRFPLPPDGSGELRVKYTATSPSFTSFSYLLPRRQIAEDAPLRNAATALGWMAVPTVLGVINTVRQEKRLYDTEAFHNTYNLFQLVLNEGVIQ